MQPALRRGFFALSQDNDVARLVSEKTTARLITARHFENAESCRVHELADLMQRICPHRDLLLELPTVVEYDRAVHLDPRREVVELDFFENHTSVALPPHAGWQIRDQIVAIENLD